MIKAPAKRGDAESRRDVDQYIKSLQERERRALAVETVGIVFGAFGAILGMLDLVGHSAEILSVAALFLSLPGLFLDSRQLGKAKSALRAPAEGDIRALREIELDSEQRVDLNSFQPSSDELARGFSRILVCGETVFVSHALDRSLRKRDFRMVLDERKYRRVRARIREHSEQLVPVLLRWKQDAEKVGREFFEEQKLCLARAIRDTREAAHYHIGGYFDSFLSNELCTKSVGGHRFDRWFPARRELTSRRPILDDLDDATMNDHIGISTLALSKDGFLTVWVQGAKAEQNVGRVVSTGSGSCNAEDLRSTLRDSIVYAMQRELFEETSLKATEVRVEDIGETRVLGFFRWVRRGGKPEFVGISRLEYDCDEFWPQASELEQGIRQRLPCRNVIELASALEAIERLPNAAVPLLCIVRSIREVLADPLESSYVTDFLFSAS